MRPQQDCGGTKEFMLIVFSLFCLQMIILAILRRYFAQRRPYPQNRNLLLIVAALAAAVGVECAAGGQTMILFGCLALSCVLYLLFFFMPQGGTAQADGEPHAKP